MTQADCARKWGVDVSTVIRIRQLAKDAALAAFASSKPGRMPSPEQVELEEALRENDRLSEALIQGHLSEATLIEVFLDENELNYRPTGVEEESGDALLIH